jgi:hypothetical protein
MKYEQDCSRQRRRKGISDARCPREAQLLWLGDELGVLAWLNFSKETWKSLPGECI